MPEITLYIHYIWHPILCKLYFDVSTSSNSPSVLWKEILLVLSMSIGVVWQCAFSLVSRARHSTVYKFLPDFPYMVKLVWMNYSMCCATCTGCKQLMEGLPHIQPHKSVLLQWIVLTRSSVQLYGGLRGINAQGIRTLLTSVHVCWLMDNSVHCCSHALVTGHTHCSVGQVMT